MKLMRLDVLGIVGSPSMNILPMASSRANLCVLMPNQKYSAIISPKVVIVFVCFKTGVNNITIMVNHLICPSDQNQLPVLWVLKLL